LIQAASDFITAIGRAAADCGEWLRNFLRQNAVHVLDLTNCVINIEGSSSLHNVLHQKNLRTLVLNGLNLDDSVVAKVIENLCSPSLAHLDLRGNKAGVESAAALAKLIVQQNCLTNLRLENNLFKDVHIVNLVEALLENKRIESLSMGVVLSDKSVIALAQLVKHSSLRSLCFTLYIDASLTQQGLTILEDIIANTTTIKELKLHGNTNHLNHLNHLPLIEALYGNYSLLNLHTQSEFAVAVNYIGIRNRAIYKLKKFLPQFIEKNNYTQDYADFFASIGDKLEYINHFPKPPQSKQSEQLYLEAKNLMRGLLLTYTQLQGKKYSVPPQKFLLKKFGTELFQQTASHAMELLLTPAMRKSVASLTAGRHPNALFTFASLRKNNNEQIDYLPMQLTDVTTICSMPSA